MDMEFLNLLTNIRMPILTWINLALTVLGESAVFIAAFCLIYWCIDKHFAYRLGIIYVISGLIVQTPKILFRIPRPWLKDSSFRIVEQARNTATGYSFPSGHTQNVTALFSSLALKSKKKLLKILCFAVIFLVMFSRMYLGVHTPTDVLVSFAITLVISLIINYYAENYSVDSSHKSLMWGLLFILPVLSTGICIYVYFGVPDVIKENLNDVLMSSGAAFGFLTGYLIERKHIRFNEHAATPVFQAIKYIIGIASVIGLNYLTELITDTFFTGFMPAYFIAKMLLMLYITAVYPLIIKKLFTDDIYL